MKSNQILTLALTMAIAACNGSGGRKTVGSQCPGGDYKPVREELAPNQQKVDLRAEDFAQVPPGVYEYTGSTLYYHDKSDLRLQLEDVRQKDGSFKASWGCARNSIRPLSGPIQVESISKMTVNADHKVTIDEVRQMGISLKDGKLDKSSSKVEKTVGAPKETINDKTKDFFFVLTDNNQFDFEIRAFGGDENGKFSFAARFKRRNE